MADLGTLRVTLVANLKGFIRSLDLTSSTLRKFGRDVRADMKRAGTAIRDFAANARRALSNFARKWLRRATIAIAGFVVASVKMASDVAESENLVRESFKGMTEDVIKWSDAMQSSLGLNAFKLREQAGMLNLTTKSMGLTEDQAFRLSTTITELTVGVASLRDKKFSEIFEKMRSGLLGMSRPLQQIGITVKENAVNQLLLANNMGVTFQQLTENQKIMARYILILQQTETDTSDFIRTSDEFKNVMRVVADQVQLASISLGKRLLPTVTETAIRMRNWLMGNQEEIRAWFDTAVSKFEAFVTFLQADFHQGFQGSLNILLLTAGFFSEALIAVFMDAFETIGSDAAKAFFDAWKKSWVKRAASFKATAKTVVSGITKLLGGETTKSVDEAAESISNLEAVLLRYKANVDAIVADTHRAAAKTAGFVMFGGSPVAVPEEFIRQWKAAETEAKRRAAIAEQVAEMEAKRNAELASALGSLQTDIDNTQGALDGVSADGLVQEMKTATDLIREMFDDVADAMRDVIVSATSGAADAFTTMLETIAQDFGDFDEAVRTFIKSLMREIAVMQARLLAAKILGSSSEGGGGLGGIFGSIFTALAGGAGGGTAQAKSRGGMIKPVYAAAGFAPRGTDTVPAMLSPGEGVLSKDLTGMLREQLAVPGGVDQPQPLIIQVQTIDTQSTAQWLNNNKRLLAGMLNETRMGNNPASRRLGGRV